MSYLRRIVITVLLVVVLSGSALASGFGIYEHGIRANGFAGAFAGMANDASAIYYNPAGLSFMKEGSYFLFGNTFISPSLTWNAIEAEKNWYSDANGDPITQVDVKRKIFPPVNIYYTKTTESGLAYGIGLYNPFGLGIFWPDEVKEDWPGRFNIVDIDLKTFYLTPTVSYKINDNLSAAVGVSLAHAIVSLSKRTDFRALGAEPLAELSGTSNSIGFNFGLMYKAGDDLSIGFQYKHSTNFDFEGEAEFSDLGPLAGELPPTDDITTSITLPSTYVLGTSYKLSDKIAVNGDFTMVNWSSYDKLAVEFKDNPSLNIDSPKEWKDVWNIRVGAEYIASETMAFQFGFLFDNNPAPDEYVEPLLPDSDRTGFSFGFDRMINDNLSLNVSYIHLLFAERETTVSASDPVFNGRYTAWSPLLGLGIGYDF